MIEIALRRVKPGREAALREWFQQLRGPRRQEALSTLEAEGIAHETAILLESSDGLVLIYAIESADPARARAIASASTEAIDPEHREILKSCLTPINAEQVLDLNAQPAVSSGG